MNKVISPNFDERPNGTESIKILVMHYTGMETAELALKHMCNKDAKVSAHYMIYENGDIIQLVDENKRAWHAGISCWRGIAALNDISIGIEIVIKGHEWGYEKFTDAQMESTINLSKEIIKRHHIEPRNIVGHSDIAASRKQDPGELFNWQLLASENIGLWPEVKVLWKKDKILVEPASEGVAVADIQSRLAKYGYHIRVDGNYGSKMEDVVIAFKRHFVPEQLNSSWDKLSDLRLNKLLEMIKK